MPDEELTLILRLRDEATKQMKSARLGSLPPGPRLLRRVSRLERSGTRPPRPSLTAQAQQAKRSRVSRRIIRRSPNLGTGLRRQSLTSTRISVFRVTNLRMVAEAALKAKVDTNLFGDVSAAQLGLDAQGSAQLLDQLVVASQNTGVSVDRMTQGIGKSLHGGKLRAETWTISRRSVVQLSDEFGPSGLRGAMSEIMEEVDKGLIPTVHSLETHTRRHNRGGRAHLPGWKDVARYAQGNQGRGTWIHRSSRRRARRDGVNRYGACTRRPSDGHVYQGHSTGHGRTTSLQPRDASQPYWADHHRDHTRRTGHLQMARSDLGVPQGRVERADTRARKGIQLHRTLGAWP